MPEYTGPLPVPTPETRSFWEATRRHELLLQRCRACGRHHFYPRGACPHCLSADLEWRRVSGRGSLHTFTIVHRGARNFPLPSPYVLAVVMVYIFAVKLQWFPAIGYTSLTANPIDNLRSLTLPAIAIGFPLFSVYTRLLRADIVEQMQREDYIVTARAKGVPPWRVLIRHALPNSLFGLITLVALNLGTLVGAVAIIEPIFSLPGVGAILISSITNHDVPIVEGVVLVFAVVVVVAALAADLLYAVLDPRIRYERSAS